MPELCETLRKEAGFVWHRMHKSAHLGLSLSEETLTECALYNIAIAHQGSDIVIDLATKPAEAKHGADWEWWLIRNKQAICFRVQAKRLFANGRYSSLLKAAPNQYQQLDKLVSSSAKDGCEPLYCFYNFNHSQVVLPKAAPCKHSYRGPSFWGCALAFPDQVKVAQSDQFTKLRPSMHPWHTLVCQLAKGDNLLSSAKRFVSQRGQRQPRIFDVLPSRVTRLLELGDQGRARVSEDRRYLDFSYWDGAEDGSSNLAGLIIFRDLRD